MSVGSEVSEVKIEGESNIDRILEEKMTINP